MIIWKLHYKQYFNIHYYVKYKLHVDKRTSMILI